MNGRLLLRGASSLCLGWMLGATGALAQAPAATPPTGEPISSPPGDGAALGLGQARPETANATGEIVVTGSRIARQDYTSTSPILTVPSERFEQSAAVSVERTLNQLPQFSGSIDQSSSFPNRGGQANLNLRGLGTNRSLVLLDGKRIQPSNADGTIDVNVIPTNLIATVETVTGGASATYGSDAMSGVVNFILKKKFTGLQLDAQYGNTWRTDGSTFSASALLGSEFADDRGRAFVSLSYAARGQIKRGDRAFFEHNTTNVRLPYATNTLSNNPPTQAAVDAIFAKYGFPAGSVARTALLGTNPDGSLFSTPGTAPVVNYKGPLEPNYSIINNAVVNNSGRTYDIQIPMKRYNVFARGEYDLNDWMTVHAQALFTNYQVEGGGPQLSLGAGGSSGTVPVTNPFIPADLKALLAARANPTAPFTINYLFTQLEPYRDVDRYNVLQAELGVEGKIPGSDISYDVYGSYGITDASLTLFGAGSLTAANTLLAAADGGRSLCAGGFNPWGPPEQSTECAKYIRRDPTTTSRFTQANAEASLQGSVLSLPAGPLRFAAGVSYRRDHYETAPADLFQHPGEGIGVVLAFPVSVSQNVKEGFVELLIPLLKDLPLIKELNADVAYRYSDYSTVGGISTYKADLEWLMFDQLRLRGGYGRAIRAPSLGELFTAASQTSIQIGTPSATTTAGDPCDVRSSFRLGPNGSKVRALCVAQGVPAAAVDTYVYSGTTVFAATSGNPNLKEEKADTYSLGAVLRSPFSHPMLSGLQASVDYFNIKITNAIGTLPFLTGLGRCFNVDGSNPNYDPANVNCTVAGRAVDGRLATGSIPTLNLASYRTDGIDFQLDWRIKLSDLVGAEAGTLSFNEVLARKLSFKLQTLPGTAALDYAGYSSSPLAATNALQVIPKWKSQFTVNYGIGAFDIGGRWRYIGGVKDVTRVTSPASTVPSVPSRSYFDLFGDIRIGKTYEIGFGVTNVFDKGPPQVSSALDATDQSTYDVIGRSFYVRGRVVF